MTEYKFCIEYYFTSKQIRRNAKGTISAESQEEAESKIRNKYPNITKLEMKQQEGVAEQPQAIKLGDNYIWWTGTLTLAPAETKLNAEELSKLAAWAENKLSVTRPYSINIAGLDNDLAVLAINLMNDLSEEYKNIPHEKIPSKILLILEKWDNSEFHMKH